MGDLYSNLLGYQNAYYPEAMQQSGVQQAALQQAAMQQLGVRGPRNRYIPKDDQELLLLIEEQE
jgi:hypothetical protein